MYSRLGRLLSREFDLKGKQAIIGNMNYSLLPTAKRSALLTDKGKKECWRCVITQPWPELLRIFLESLYRKSGHLIR